MSPSFARYWPLLLIRGGLPFLSLFFAIAPSFGALGTIFGEVWVFLLGGRSGDASPEMGKVIVLVYLAVDLALALAISYLGRTMSLRWWFTVSGIIALGVRASFLAMHSPLVPIHFYLLVAWALIHGAMELADAIRLRKETQNARLFFAIAVLSLLAGATIFTRDSEIRDGGFASFAILAYPVVWGFWWLCLALRLRLYLPGADRDLVDTPPPASADHLPGKALISPEAA